LLIYVDFMARINVTWYGERVTRQIQAELHRRMNLAGLQSVRDAQRMTARPFPPAAEPPELAARRTGRLQRSFFARTSDIGRSRVRLQVGSSATRRGGFPYLAALEKESGYQLHRTVYRRVREILGL
jgi:hypothetical protein